MVSDVKAKNKENPMKEIRLSKVVLNIGLKESGEKVEKAVKLLNVITNKKPTKTYATRKARTFKIRKGLPIGAKVTLRGNDAKKVLLTLLKAVDSKLKESNFDENGNFSFGIHEYLEIPGIKYDPYIGMMGLNVTVGLERPGFRIKRRKLKKAKVSKNHKITKAEAIDFARKNFGINV